MKLISFAVVLYLLGAVVTNGLYAANNEERCASRFDRVERRSKCMWGGEGAMAAIFWPLYWPTKLTYEIARN